MALKTYTSRYFYLHTIAGCLLLLMLCSVPTRITAAAVAVKVIVILDSTAPEGERAFSVIQGHTADLPVNLQVERTVEPSTDLKAINRYFILVAEEYHADIILFSDFSDKDMVVLYVSMPKLGTTLIRNIDAGGETIESRFEITAVVIRGILTAMTSSGDIGVHVPNVSGTADPNASVDSNKTVSKFQIPISKNKSKIQGIDGIATVEPKSKDTHLELQVSYGAGLVSDEIPLVHNFQPMVRFPIKMLCVFLAYRFTLPFGKEDATLSLELFPHPMEAGFWISFRKGDFFFHLGAAAIFDLLTAKVISKMTVAAEKSDTTGLRFGVSPLVAMDWFFSRRAFLHISISADIYVYQNAFYIEKDTGKEVFLRLWTATPLFQIGFGFGVI